MAVKDCCFIGKGKVYIREQVSFCPTSANPNPNAFLYAGNVSQYQVEIEETEITQEDFTSATGGDDCSLRKIDAINANLIFNCWDISNLSRAMFASLTELTTPVAITDELHTVQGTCTFVPLAELPDATQTVVVSSGPTTYTAVTDYIVRGAGIEIPEGSTIAAGTEIEVDYTPITQDTLDLFQSASKEYEVVIDGVNQNDLKPFRVHLFRVKLSPAATIDFIGADEFASFEMSGTVLKDTCKLNASGLAQYGTFKRVK